MTKTKYAEALEAERENISNLNPFSKEEVKIDNTKKERTKTPFYQKRQKSSNYFNLILDSDFEDIELEVRGLKYVQYIDDDGKKFVELEKKDNHYLSESGAEQLLTELKMHTSSDLKLGYITKDEFQMTMDIVHEAISTFMQDNMINMGMDTEEKQRKAPLLTVAILNRIRMVYSRSIEGIENRRSHGDISISGNLESEKESKFDLEEARN